MAATSIGASNAVTDLGVAPSTDVKHIMISLKVVDRPALEAFVASTVDRTSANFGKFITPEQFAARYGQSPAVLGRVQAFLTSHGLSITKVYGNNLAIEARGTNAQLTKLFGTEIHSVTSKGETYQRPAGTVTIPAAISDVVAHVAGLSTKSVYRSAHAQIPAAERAYFALKAARSVPADAMPTPGIPGQYDLADLESLYNITPLYSRGLTGAGTTLGIMTFANFTLSDVGAYWAGNGLSSSTARVSVVQAGSGSVGSNGADETTLDVEQSGGVAPGANIVVYEAANNAAGELALYTTAITANKADTLSISWGGPEVGEDPTQQSQLDTLFLESASQGVPITAASADSGAFDLNNEQSYPYPYYSATLSVDFPGSSPYVLSAGGTTLPNSVVHKYATVTVPTERPWAWDYLENYIVTYYGQSTFYGEYFPVGGGGGVSVNYPLPSFQTGLAGTQVSLPGQSLVCFQKPPAGTAQPCKVGTDLVDVPGGVVGRNVPDVSMNADPYSGYTIYYQGAWGVGDGGTSYVAPQLNGIFALITQQKGKRLGWLHPQLYGAFSTQGYGSGSPFRAITTGDNWYWPATAAGFNPATGIGTINVDNLSKTLTAD